MDSSSSPIVLYLGDDEDDNNNNEQNSYFGINQTIPRVSSSIAINSGHKKRKIPIQNYHPHSTVDNRSKRQRNDHYQQRPSSSAIDTDLDSELILLDPNEYIIEEPDSQPFRSFDWTIQPQPTSSQLIPTRIDAYAAATRLRVSAVNENNTTRRSMDRVNTILRTNPKERFVQQQPPPKSNTMPPPRSSLASSSKPTASCARSTTQRGRPTKNSRIPRVQSTSSSSSIPSQSILVQNQQPPRPPPLTPSSATISPSSINNVPPEVRRQMLNGTGLFSAFHDSKYYHCNLCKFKSVTSSTLLQHLFTHMFFCEHCSYYTYSSFSLSQHNFEKHSAAVIEETPQPLNPTTFDLLYVTRCADGTFALCMDSSMKLPATSQKASNDQRTIISSGTPTDEQINKSAKKKSTPIQDTPSEVDRLAPVVVEKREKNPRTFGRSKRDEKSNKTYALMKHRPFFSMRKSSCLHALTLEYNICREHTIRHISHTENIDKHRRSISLSPRTRLIDEVANCLKTVVNQIVDTEEFSDQLSLIQPLSNDTLDRIFPMNNLNMLTNVLKLKNKYDRGVEEKQLIAKEHSIRFSNEHVFTLSSPETNQTEQTILSSLHSSMTNGDSIFTQTKIPKVSNTVDNTHRYLKRNSNQSTSTNNPKVSPKPVPPRPIICKPSRSLSNSSVDRNNNSLSSSSTTPTVIILD